MCNICVWLPGSRADLSSPASLCFSVWHMQSSVGQTMEYLSARCLMGGALWPRVKNLKFECAHGVLSCVWKNWESFCLCKQMGLGQAHPSAAHPFEMQMLMLLDPQYFQFRQTTKFGVTIWHSSCLPLLGTDGGWARYVCHGAGRERSTGSAWGAQTAPNDRQVINQLGA